MGGLIDGIDRKLSARMQGRVGPRLLQPFYDVAKLLRKAPASVNTMDDTYMACALIFTVVGGGIFVSGSNTLLCAFMVTLAAIFVVLASASTQSPFASARTRAAAGYELRARRFADERGPVPCHR